MTKQEAIQKAYGELWEKVKDYVDENGWISRSSCMYLKIEIGKYEAKEIQNFKFYIMPGPYSVMCIRPIELKGLEKNNYWISVTENDLLPKPGTNVFIVKDGEISKRVWTVDQLDRLVFGNETILKTQITHYKILEFPTLKPIY